MKKVFKLFFFGCLSLVLFSKQLNAQQNHFIYIQADDKQQFTVNINGKSYASSEIGYVIIPKLTDGKYKLNIEFPDDKYPDQQFSCAIDNTDVGYALKNYHEKGWGLFNLQTLDITMAQNKNIPDTVEENNAAAKTAIDTKTDTSVQTVPTSNAFGEMLSDVTNDSTLRRAAIELKAQQAKKEATASAADGKVTEFPTLNDTLLNTAKEKQDSQTVALQGIKKISQQETDTGTQMAFADPASGDTIHIFLPKQTEAHAQEPAQTNSDSSVAAVNNSDKVDDVQKSQDSVDHATEPDTEAVAKNEETNFLPDTSTAQSSQPNNPFYKGAKKTDTASKIVTEENPSNIQPAEETGIQNRFKADCKNMLDDHDLDKLKKKMVSATNDDKMIQTAKKYLEEKCITTDQVKSLGGLFLTDDARYNFFDAVYKNVYDISAFGALENQLIDPYYKKRFNAMLK